MKGMSLGTRIDCPEPPRDFHEVKSAIAMLLSSFVGVAAGWFLGYVHPASTANRRALEYMDRLEPQSIGPCVLAMTTMPLIEAGETNKAIARLADSIAAYYRTYAHSPGTNSYRIRARDAIKARARTNSILAERIEHAMTNEPLADFERVWVDEWKKFIYAGESRPIR